MPLSHRPIRSLAAAGACLAFIAVVSACSSSGGAATTTAGAPNATPSADAGTMMLHVLQQYVAVVRTQTSSGITYNIDAFTFTAQNVDATRAIVGARYVAEFLNQQGVVVGKGAGTVGPALAGATVAVSDEAQSTEPPADVRVTVYGGSARDGAGIKAFAPIDTTFDPARNEIKSVLTNSTGITIPAETVVGVVYDAQGAIVGGGLANVSFDKNGQAAVDVIVQTPVKNAAKAVLYPVAAAP